MAPKLSTRTKLRLIASFLFWTLPNAVIRSSGAFFRAWLKGLPVGPSMLNGLIGSLMDNTHPRDIQAVLPPSVEAYNAWVVSHNTPPTVDVLAADKSTHLLWIGPSKAKNVVLFFHGGGYVMPLSKGHLDWMGHMRNEALNAGVELSVCILAYDLIPGHTYPRQMSQAILALEHLEASGYKPSQIVFGGDSAGGHLSLSLMAHLHHCHPMNDQTQDLVDRWGTVRGCFLVSPLTSYDFNTPSYRRWFSADVLSKKVVQEWGLHLVGNSPWQEEISAGKGWGMALDVPDSWWDGFKAVDRVLITGGYEEVFSDHVEQLGQMLKRKTAANVTLYMAHETHDGPLLDFMTGRRPSQTTKTITDFVISCLVNN
ncbi:Alpha/Beta hydrolase protein [Aspergillus unguis]